MKSLTTYTRHDPDTTSGHKLEVRILYTTFDKEEMDQLEENCRKVIGNGLNQNIKKVREV